VTVLDDLGVVSYTGRHLPVGAVVHLLLCQFFSKTGSSDRAVPWKNAMNMMLTKIHKRRAESRIYRPHCTRHVDAAYFYTRHTFWSVGLSLCWTYW